jgi:hypothetical protein
MIALARNALRSSPRYRLAGELSRNASWVQTLEIPADGSSVSITGQTVRITFRECEDQTSADLTVSSADSQITISDADTLTISVTDEVMGGLSAGSYTADLTSETGGVVTHWAQGVVKINDGPVAW